MISISEAQRRYASGKTNSVFFVDLIPYTYVGFFDSFKKKRIKTVMIFLGKVKSQEEDLNVFAAYSCNGHFYDCKNDVVHTTPYSKYDSFLVLE